jgi:hypothetical protein
MNASSPEMNLIVNDYSKAYLLETSKWANFLAIISSIIIFFFILICLFVLTFSTAAMSFLPDVPYAAFAGMIISILVWLGIMIYPILSLFRFSAKAKSAIERNNNNELQEAFRNQRNTFRYYGVIVILGLILNIISFFGFIL